MDIDFCTMENGAHKPFATWSSAQHVPRVGDFVVLNLRDYRIVLVHWETQRTVTITVESR